MFWRILTRDFIKHFKEFMSPVTIRMNHCVNPAYSGEQVWAGHRNASSLSDGEGWWPHREHSWSERPAAEAGETLDGLGSDPHGVTQLSSQIISETGFLVFGDFKKQRAGGAQWPAFFFLRCPSLDRSAPPALSTLKCLKPAPPLSCSLSQLRRSNFFETLSLYMFNFFLSDCVSMTIIFSK